MAGPIASTRATAHSILHQSQALLDMAIPSQQRAEHLARLKAFTANNPKVSTFAFANIALTGIPLICFTTFILAVFVFSFVTAFLVALGMALLLSTLAFGTAMLFLIPTVLLTTGIASYTFVWFLVGYYVFKWLSSLSDSNNLEQQRPGNGSRIKDSTAVKIDPAIDELKERKPNGSVPYSATAVGFEKQKSDGHQQVDATSMNNNLLNQSQSIFANTQRLDWKSPMTIDLGTMNGQRTNVTKAPDVTEKPLDLGKWGVNAGLKN